jgi:SNF2 family DNA or RNA helicase
VRLKDEKDIERWNESEIPILLAHPASAGHGLNLQFGGSTIVWYTLTYSLEYYQQANARLHRHGQKNKVMIHHLTVRDSIDDAVIDALNNKDHNQEALLAALKYRVQKISDRTKSLDLTP